MKYFFLSFIVALSFQLSAAETPDTDQIAPKSETSTGQKQVDKKKKSEKTKKEEKKPDSSKAEKRKKERRNEKKRERRKKKRKGRKGGCKV